ncbi:MAG TPA: hypothetical protein VJQ45_00745 [Ktedonobacterales bacterium]|nr:hypothetical protein [Ktedonobacterales bacterium]
MHDPQSAAHCLLLVIARRTPRERAICDGIVTPIPWLKVGLP